jgi:hypothetical protein
LSGENKRREEFKLCALLNKLKKIIGTSNWLLRERPVMLMTAFSWKS